MKKLILFLLLPLWAMAQTSNGGETEFDYGIKNNSTQTITTPPYLTTTGMDGTQGKIPSALLEKTDNKQNSLAIDGTGTKYPTVDAVNAALPKTYATIVYVNTTSPTTATVFDDENPPTVNDNTLKNDADNLYIGLDASTWVYNGSIYITKSIPDGSNFFIRGTTVDAGNSKTENIERIGGIKTSQTLDASNVNTGGLLANSIISNNETPNTIASFDASKQIKSLPTITYPSLTELSYVKGVTSGIQAQINSKADLDGSGKVPLSQINDALLGSVNYKGTYNATTNVPAIPTATSSNKGWYYIISTAGTQQGFNFVNGDWIISNGTSWGKVDNNNTVTSVNGQVGAVNLTKSDVGLSNADNTSDINKPVSTAQQTALNLKENSFAKNTAFNKNFGTTAGTVVEGGTLGSNAYSSTAYLPLSGGKIIGSIRSMATEPIAGKVTDNTPYRMYEDGVNVKYGIGLSSSGGINYMSNQAAAGTSHRFYGGRDNDNPKLLLSIEGDGDLDALGTVTATSFNGSATLTGTPTAPTAAPGTNDNTIANAAFVKNSVDLAAYWTKTGGDIINNNTGIVYIGGAPTGGAGGVPHKLGSNTGIVTSGQFASNVGYGFGDGLSGMFESGGKLMLRMYNPKGVGIQNVYQDIASGTQNDLSFVNSNIKPTSGNAVFNNIAIEPTINQTGGANGITRSLYINPTLTSAFDFRAIEVTAGKVIVPVTIETAIQEYADNAAALSAGLAIGTHYRTGDLLKIVH